MLAEKVSVFELKSGAVDLLDVVKLNAMLDYELAQQHAATKKGSK